MPFRVLFLCTGNSARSILSEATLNHYGQPRFVGYSGGSKPAGAVNPRTLAQLKATGISTENLHSKNFALFAREGAPVLDAVITLCDSAQLDPCPVFFGDFIRAHWGMPDPVDPTATETENAKRFANTHATITSRIRALVELPVERMSRDSLAQAPARIAERYPSRTERVSA